MIWKWVGSTIFTIGLVLPFLELAAQSVRERQFKMKDLLEISGLYNISYWASFLLSGFFALFISLLIFCLLLLAGTVFTQYHFGPYVGLLTCFILALMSFMLIFGFIVFKVEYYGLPTFLGCVIFSVCGDYVANAYHLSIGLKCKLVLI